MTVQTLRFPRGLYGITPSDTPHEVLLKQVEQACQGSMTALQWRRKSLTPAQSLQQAPAIQKICQQHNCLFIVNDDIDLALQLGADGVHLGKDDASIAQARQTLQKRDQSLLIGVSCYNDLELAKQAILAEVDYLAFGAVFPSSTKPNATRAPLNLFEQSQALIESHSSGSQTQPALVAIGGITTSNATSVVQAGADSLAVIQGLFTDNLDSHTISDIAQQFTQLLKQAAR